MDFISILATILLFTTVGTLIVAVAAYAAFKLRERRKPGKKTSAGASEADIEPIFLDRYVPGEGDTDAVPDGGR